MSPKEERHYYLAFSAFEEGIGPHRFKLLLDYFHSAQNAWSAKQTELIKVGIPLAIVQKFIDFRRKFDPKIYEKQVNEAQVRYITLLDDDYPYLLKQISDPPIVLYVRGNILFCHSESREAGRGNLEPENRLPRSSLMLGARNDNEKKILAVVGTRKMTAYGREMTENLVADLSLHGFTIVSGMALGIDTVAHRTAIENHGKTIAVLGCGVDVIYPPENEKLYYTIINSGGCIISEMPMGHWATRGTFPARNRIISGLSNGVLMVEGAITSGALITCSYAAEQGRQVYAVPGAANSSLSQGTLSLLKKGAKLVTCTDDILEDFGLEKAKKNNHYNNNKDYKNYNDYPSLSTNEKSILESLSSGGLTVDDMIKKSGINVKELNTLLSLLEIKGYIYNEQGVINITNKYQ